MSNKYSLKLFSYTEAINIMRTYSRMIDTLWIYGGLKLSKQQVSEVKEVLDEAKYFPKNLQTGDFCKIKSGLEQIIKKSKHK